MSFSLHLKAAAAACLLLPALAQGQTQFTENFEGVNYSPTDTLAKPTSFSNGGFTFNLITNNCAGGTFGVFIRKQRVLPCNGGSMSQNLDQAYGVGTSCSGGNCTGTSDKLIDNTGIGFGNTYAANQIFAIKTANAARFTVKNLFLYLSANSGNTPSSAGGVTFRGKVNGNTVFTFVKTTGFDTSFSSNNGFTYIDFGSHVNTNIDELEIQGGATANYVAIDNFTFGTPSPLPVTISEFKVSLESGAARLDWQAMYEVGFDYYEIQRSSDGANFTAIGRQQGQGKSVYQYFDRAMVSGTSFYRLRMVDRDGQAAFSQVAKLEAGVQAAAAYVYPNPASGSISVRLPAQYTAAELHILDLSGRVVRRDAVGQNAALLPLQGIAPGLYQYRITAGDHTLGQGKLTIR